MSGPASPFERSEKGEAGPAPLKGWATVGLLTVCFTQAKGDPRMTHRNESTTESNPLDQMIQVLDEHGFDGMARAIQILVNEAMKIERSEVLGAEPYERTSERLGYANAQ